MYTIAQQYFKNQYDAYLRLKTQLELQDIERELELEQLEEEPDIDEELEKILREEEIIF